MKGMSEALWEKLTGLSGKGECTKPLSPMALDNSPSPNISLNSHESTALEMKSSVTGPEDTQGL